MYLRNLNWGPLTFALMVLFLGCDSARSQTNTSKPEFVGEKTLSGRVLEEFRYQILIGGKGREWVGSDTFTNAGSSKSWINLTNRNGNLTNSGGQLNLVATGTASASNPVLGVRQWSQPLPRNDSWLAYMEMVVSNSLPVTQSQSASMGISLFQSNRPSGSLVFTNFSKASLMRRISPTNQKSSSFLLNNVAFEGTFQSNTSSQYQRQSGTPTKPSTAASLIFSNVGSTSAPVQALAYRSTTNSILTNNDGLMTTNSGPATAVASPVLILASSTNWAVEVRAHCQAITNFFAPCSLGPVIVKNQPGKTPLEMYTNRVSLALGQDVATGFPYVTSDAFPGLNYAAYVWAVSSDEITLLLEYDSSSTTLTCSYEDPDYGWLPIQSFSLARTPGSLGTLWNFNPGIDSFRLLLAADTAQPGGNGNGQDPRMYFTDLVVATEPADQTAASDGNTLWVGLLYDAVTTNLIHQFSPPDGAYSNLTSVSSSSMGLLSWGSNSLSPLQLRLDGQAGQTNLPLGAVAGRTFAVIPAPGTMSYRSTNLPPGLSLNTNYGVISGVPVSAGTTNFTVVASNPFGGLTATQTFQLTIVPTYPQLEVTSNGILKFNATNTNALIVTATNSGSFGTNPLTFSASGLPAGVVLKQTINGTQAIYGGIPADKVGTNNSVVFTASNSLVGAVTITSIVTVQPGIPALTLVPSSPLPKYNATSVVSTTTPFWILSNSAVGQNPVAFPNTFAAISNFPTNTLRLISSNGQIVAMTNRITNAGNFTNVLFSVSNQGGVTTLTSTITILPAPPILVLNTTPPFPSNGIPLGASNSNFFQILVDSNAPGFAAGFANSFALDNGPLGISINPTNGIVGGTNRQAGIFNLKILVRNAGGGALTNLVLNSIPSAPLFSVTTNRAQFGSNSPNALVFTLTNTANLATNDFSVTWGASNLPPGFTSALVGTNFVIRSTNPTTAGSFPDIVITASNAGGATTNSNISLEVLPAIPALGVASNNLPFQYGATNNTNGIVVTVTNTNGGAQNISLFPIAFSASNLPGGWALSTNGGGLVGVIGSANPTQATNVTNLLVTVTNKGGSSSTNLTMRVLPSLPSILIDTNTNNRLQYGNSTSTNAVNVVVNPAGQNTNDFPVAFLATNLPGGVLLTTNASNRLIGVIGGTNPTQAGIFTNVQLTITNVAGTNLQTLSLTVLPAAPRFTVDTNRAQFGSNSTNPLVVTVTNTNGQNQSAFPLFFSSSNLPGGLAFTNTNVFVGTVGSSSPNLATNNASFTVVVTNAGGSATSNVTGFRILPALPALLAATNGTFRYQTPSASNAVTVSLTNTNGQNTNAGQFPIGFTASNLPGGLGFSTNGFIFNLTGSPSVTGIFTNITVRATNLAGAATNVLTLRLLPAAPVLSSGPISTTRYMSNNPSIVVFSVFMTNTNAQNFTDFPISYSVSSNLPAGLILTTNTNNFNATISGTPITAGIFSNITVTATNAGGAVSQPFDLTILPAGPALSVLSNNTFQYGVSFSNGILVAATNTNALFTNFFPISFSLGGTVPLGIGVTSTNTTTNGLVADLGGTNPAQAGTFTNVQLTAANAGGTATTNLTVTVLPARPLFSATNNRTQFAINSPNALVITVTNGAGQNVSEFPIFVTSSNLPAGIAFTNTNGLVGTAGSTNPTLATNAIVTVVVSNAAGATTNTNVGLTILPAAPLFSVTSNRTQFGVNSSNALVVTVTNTNAGAQNTSDFPDFGFSVTPALSGLTFSNTNGLVATYGGTNPTVVTNATLTVVVTNAGGATTNTNVSLAVLPALPLFSATNYRTQYGSNSSNALVVTVTNTNGQNTNAGQFPNFAFFSTNLVGGIAFTNTNGLVGTAGSTNPTLATNAIVTVVVSNAAGATTNTNVGLTILPAAPRFSVDTNSLQFGVNCTNALVVTVTNTNAGAQNTSDFPDFGFVSTNLSNSIGIIFTNTNGLTAVAGGTPSATPVTNASVIISVTNAGGTNTTNLTLRLLPSLPTFFTYVTNNGPFRAGQTNANLTVAVTNGQNTNDYPIAYSQVNLPTGLILNSSSGLVSGTPSVSATFPAVFTASNQVGTGTNTNSLNVSPGAPQLLGASSNEVTLTTNDIFFYQVGARGAGQLWAGRSDFTNALGVSWNTNSASNSEASLATGTNANLLYRWNTTNSNNAFITWKEALPLDSGWQVSVRANFSSNSQISDLSGLNFSNTNQYLETGLFAFKDSVASLSNYSVAFFSGDTNQTNGFVAGSGATNGVETSGLSTNASAGLAYLGLNYATNGALVSQGNPNDTNGWTPVFTNTITSWTNPANSNTLVLRLKGSSYAPTNTLYAAEFSDFVIVPLGNLTYSQTGLPAGLVLDTNTGLITGKVTSSGTNTATIVVSNAFGTVTNTILFKVGP